MEERTLSEGRNAAQTLLGRGPERMPDGTWYRLAFLTDRAALPRSGALPLQCCGVRRDLGWPAQHGQPGNVGPPSLWRGSQRRSRSRKWWLQSVHNMDDCTTRVHTARRPMRFLDRCIDATVRSKLRPPMSILWTHPAQRGGVMTEIQVAEARVPREPLHGAISVAVV